MLKKLIKTCFPILMIMGILLFQNCSNIVEDLGEDVVISIETDVLATPLTLQFVDANEEDYVVPANINVSFLGANTDRLYSLSGNSNIQPTDGLMDIGVRNLEDFSADNPLEFTVRATAPGYLPAFQSFSISEDVTRSMAIPMIKYDNLPEGVSFSQESFSVNQDGTMEEVNVVSDKNGNMEESASVTIPAGTKVFDANGIELTGTVRMDLVYFDNRSEASLNAMTGNHLANQAKDENGQDLGTISFETVGLYALDMFVGNTEVKSFSNVIQVKMELNGNTIHPATGETIQIGDEIPIWRLEESTGSWQIESSITVAEENGQLVGIVEHNRLSFRNLAFGQSTCDFSLSIVSNIGVEDAYRNYYAELFNATTNQRVRGWRNNKLRFYNGETVSMSNIPEGIMAKIVIYEGNRFCKGEVLFESSVFSTCSSQSVDVSGLQNTNATIDLSAIVYCGSDRSYTIKPTIYIYYRETGACRFFTHLASMKNGILKTGRLNSGVDYDFLAVFDGEAYSRNAVQVDELIGEAMLYEIELAQSVCDDIIDEN